MENAAKALIMAGGVLIGILILSLAAYLFASFGGTSQVIQERIDQSSLDQFNNKFISYQEKQCTIYDILTIVNYANEFNDKNEYTQADTKYYIKVEGVDGIANDLTIEKINHDINSSDPNYGKSQGTGIEKKFILTKYKCEIGIDSETKRVNHVQVSKYPVTP